MKVLVSILSLAAATPAVVGQANNVVFSTPLDDNFEFNFAGVQIDPDLASSKCHTEWLDVVGCMAKNCDFIFGSREDIETLCPQLYNEYDFAITPGDEVPSYCGEMESFYCSQFFTQEMSDCCIPECSQPLQILSSCLLLETTNVDRSECPLYECTETTTATEEAELEQHVSARSGLTMTLDGPSSLGLRDIRNWEMAAAQHSENIIMGGQRKRNLLGKETPLAPQNRELQDFSVLKGWAVILGVNVSADLLAELCPDEWQSLISCVISDCPGFMDVCEAAPEDTPSQSGDLSLTGPTASRQSVNGYPSCQDMEDYFCRLTSNPDCCLRDCAASFQSAAQCVLLETNDVNRYDCPPVDCPIAVANNNEILAYQTIFQVTNAMELLMEHNATQLVVKYKQTVAYETTSSSMIDSDYLFQHAFSTEDLQSQFVGVLKEHGDGLDAINDSGYVGLAEAVQQDCNDG